MTEPGASADRAYLDHRSTRNALRRWNYALLLIGIAGAYLAVDLARGEFRFDGILSRRESYALAFSWILGVAAAGLLLGRRPRSARIDDGWVALLLAGMVALVRLDAAVRDLSAYALISLPVAIVYSTDTRHNLLLHGGALVAAVLAILHAVPYEADMLGFFVTLLVCCATAIYVAVKLEHSRREEFLAAHALDQANRELAARSELLAQANAGLEASHQQMAARSAELARLNTELAARSRALEEVNRRLEQMAMTDPLTGVANRRQLFESLDHEFARARRYTTPLTIALIDLDDFGQVNKVHGVIAGDEVLAGFAALLRERVRAVDLLGRYGGEEFVVVMPDSGIDAAQLLLSRFREQLAQTPIGARGLAVTFSAGVTALTPADADPLALLNRADEAMRRAKAAGKNRTTET